jgi:hypothetical protein
LFELSENWRRGRRFGVSGIGLDMTEDLTHRPYLRSIQIEGRTFILNVERRHASVPTALRNEESP